MYQSSYASYDSLTGYYDFLSRSYDPALGRFFAMDPAGQFHSPYMAMGNIPMMGVDEDGEFFVPALIGAAIAIATNGVSNVINDTPFFRNAGVAALTGAIGGAASFGIGQLASKMSGLSKLAFQTTSHGMLGGSMSEATGGDFGSGFLSGALGSMAGAGLGEVTKESSKFVKGLSTIGGGATMGGLGAEIGGGNFWDGFRNGAISSGLNHAVHTGGLGKGIMMASLTGRTRHLFGPDAKQIGLTGDASFGGTAQIEASLIKIMRGEDSGYWGAIDKGAGGLTDIQISGGVEVSDFYYTGKVANLNHTTFEGFRVEANANFTLLPSVSGGISIAYSRDIHNERLYGIGNTLTIGASALDGIGWPYTVGVNAGTTELNLLMKL